MSDQLRLFEAASFNIADVLAYWWGLVLLCAEPESSVFIAVTMLAYSDSGLLVALR